jgi:UDP-N-acetylglucosamine--N-acetylmuramyl-(pentapeptide) pyrophosphoryl-undecaprenol N-acetylglucosamine transferase
MKKFDAEIVVGFGGYPTVAPVIAAFISRSIIILHEQNAVLGRANRWLSSIAHIIATSFELTKGLNDKHSKTVLVGNPVRNEMKKARSSSYPIIKADTKINILVIGGSAGAKILSDTVPKALLLLPTSLRKNLSITQQCRKEDLSRVVAIYKTAKQKSDIKTFFNDISQKIKNSHLVISRSGASTVAELSVIGRPAIFIPYQFAIDNHQKINADAMVKSGGAWSFDESNLQPKALANFLEEILTDYEKLRSAAHASRNFGTPKSSEVLADLISQVTKANISELKSKFKRTNTAQKLGGDYEKTPN